MTQEEPIKPITVPELAIWNFRENEWELGKKNEKGRFIGEWKWWKSPNGYLICETSFDNEGNIETFKRFHPNGEISQSGKGKNGKFVKRIWQRSTEATTEGFPSVPKYVWKAAQRCGEIPVEYDIYDQDGNHLNGKIEIPNQLKESSENETAKEALDRLEKVIEIAQEFRHKDDNNLKDYSKPVYFQKIELKEINAAEKRLNIKLPPSYVQFVTTFGLFKLGIKNKEHARLLHPSKIEKLSSDLENKWEISLEEYGAEEKDIMENIYYFSMGDEQLQICWYNCFDYNTLNPTTGEVDVLDFDYHDWDWMMNKSDRELFKDRGFDIYVFQVVNEEIESILKQ